MRVLIFKYNVFGNHLCAAWRLDVACLPREAVKPIIRHLVFTMWIWMRNLRLDIRWVTHRVFVTLKTKFSHRKCYLRFFGCLGFRNRYSCAQIAPTRAVRDSFWQILDTMSGSQVKSGCSIAILLSWVCAWKFWWEMGFWCINKRKKLTLNILPVEVRVTFFHNAWLKSTFAIYSGKGSIG